MRNLYTYLFVFTLLFAQAAYCDQVKGPVYIGFDAEVGHLTSISDDAIRMGAQVAIEEINAAGGVLGGRKLELVVKDHRSVPARGVKNIEEFAAMPDLVAVLGGKFSPVILEEIPILHEKKVIMLDVWGAADAIVDNGMQPNYCFRLSLKDSWAMDVMLDHVAKRGVKKIGALLPITGWGRSNEKALHKYLASHPKMELTATVWYSWGDKSVIDKYVSILDSGAQALVLVANEAEGSILLNEMKAQPDLKRLPIISHWGITGGEFMKMTNGAASELDLSVVQTYSFFDARRPEKLKKFYEISGKSFAIKGPQDVKSPVGVAHAYDVVHVLARAIDLAGSTDRASVRDALERVKDYDGLIKHYSAPFTSQRHEALSPDDVFMGRYDKDGHILRINR